MERAYRPSLSGIVAILVVFLFSAPARADFVESYCSSQNTAGTSSGFDWTWQSNGKCTDYCNAQGTYAFAVIQYRECWCSNLIPQQQQTISKCDVGCPGYSAEHCGSIDDGLFIYIKLAGQPSGTAGGSQSQSTSTTVSTSAPSSSSTQTPSSSEVHTSTTTSSTLQIITSRTSAQPQTSVQVITESGAIVTRTIVQTPTPNSTTSTLAAPINTGSESSGPNVGAIAGGAVGGVLALVALAGGIIFALWRRRKQRREAGNDGTYSMGSGSGGITRNASTMSKHGLLGSATESGMQYPSQVATTFNTQNSRYGDHESISPISVRRNSQPLMIDSRLNPTAVITFANANASRDSLASMDDSRDYGRQLNVRNPDLHRE